MPDRGARARRAAPPRGCFGRPAGSRRAGAGPLTGPSGHF